MTTARISGIMNGSTAGRSCGGFIQRNARLHLEDSLSANFRKGEGYHQRSYFLLRLRRMAWKLAVLLFAAAAFGGYVWVKYSGMG